MGWVVPTSANLYDFCGEYSESYDLDDALDQLGQWYDLVTHEHYFVLDMGSSLNVGKIRLSKTSAILPPDDVDVYVSDDTGDWGTAVATGIDVYNQAESTMEYVTTQKTGRYIKLVMNTAHGSNFIAWGGTGDEMLAIFDGVPGDKFTSFINMLNTSLSTTSTSYTPTDGSLGMVSIPWGDFTDIVSIRLVARTGIVGSCTPNSSPTTYVQLYDRTNSAELAVVQGTGNGVYKSDNFAGSLPAGTTLCDIRIKRGCQTSAAVYAAYLEVTQETSSETKTVIFIPIGANVNAALTSYARTGYATTMIGGARSQKHFLYEAADWSGITAAYVGATLYATATRTAYLKADTLGQTNQLAEFSETATTPQHHLSADVSGSIADGEEYTSFVKSSAIRSNAYIKNAYMRIHLTDPTKLLTMQPLNCRGIITKGSGWAEDAGGNQAKFVTGDDYFYNTTVALKHQAIICHESDTSMGGGIYDDGTRDTDADVSTTATSLERKVSGAITGIAVDSVLSPGYNLGSTGFLVSGLLGSNMLLHYITSIDNPAGGTEHTKSISETVLIIGSVFADIARSLTETLTIAGQILKASAKAFTDNPTVGDTRLTGIGRVLTENITLSQVLIKTISYVKTEILGITETFSTAAALTKTITETIDLVDSVIQGIVRELTETLTLTDSIESTIAIIRTEVLSITDTIETTLQAVLDFLDTINIDEIVVSGVKRIISDGLILAENFATASVIARIYTEVVEMTDNTYQGAKRTLQEAVELSEAIIRAVGRPISEAISLSETLTTVLTFTKTLTDSLNITEAYQRIIQKLSSEILSITENFDTTSVIQLVFAETLLMIEALTAGAKKIFTETIALAETFYRSTVNVLTETIEITEDIVAEIHRILTDVFDITEAFDMTSVLQRSFSEVLTITEVFSSGLSRVITETLTMVESFIHAAAKNLSETINVTEDFNIRVFLGTIISETLIVSEEFVKVGRKILTETISVVEAYIRSIARTFSEGLTLTETFVPIANKILNETLLMQESILYGVAKTLEESIDIIQTTVSGVERIFVETLSLSDIVAFGRKEVVSETITLAEAIVAHSQKLLIEVLEVGESFVRTTVKTFIETVAVTELFIRGKIFGEVLAISDVMTRGVRLTFTEVFTLLDKLRVIFNGILTALWSKENKDTRQDDWKKTRKDL